MKMLWGSKGPAPTMATIRPALMTLVVLGNRASHGCVASPVTWPTPEDVTARFQHCCRLCQLLFSSCMLHPLAMVALPRLLMYRLMASSVCPAVTHAVPVVTPTRHPTVPMPSLAGCRKPGGGAAVLIGLGVVGTDGTGVGLEMVMLGTGVGGKVVCGTGVGGKVVLGTGVGGKVMLVGTGVGDTAFHGVARRVHA